MSEPIKMPALGESIDEGTVTTWLKNVGDTVEADEPIVEVSTDKVDTEVPAPAAGVLESIEVGEDETVSVGTVLAVIGGEAPAAPAPAAPKEEPKAEPAPAPAPAPQPAPQQDVYYQNCTAARAAGAAPIYQGQPGYRSQLDRDHDGVACE